MRGGGGYHFGHNAAHAEKCKTLHKAIAGNDLKAVQAALRDGASFAWRNDEGRNALAEAVFHDADHILSHYKNSDFMKRLTDKRLSLIEFAISIDKPIKKIDFLRQLNAPLTAEADNKTWHVLHTIARMGRIDYVDHFIDITKDIDVKDSNGKTPLHYACSTGQTGMVEKLLAQGADPLAADKNGVTPLYLAMTRGKYPGTVNALIDVPEVLQHINRFKTKDTDETLLMTAILHGHSYVAMKMIDAGANIHAKDNRHQQPLFLAAKKGRIEVVKHLLKNGADIQKASRHDKDNSTMLHHVAMDNYKEIVGALVKHGADINAVDCWGKTPLHHVCKTVTPEKIKVLLAHGAHINQTDKHGRRALDIAMRNGEDNYLEYSQDEFNATILLLKNKADPNLPENTSLFYSPLHQALRHDNETLVRRLLECGADVEARVKNDKAETALHICAHKKYAHMIPLLLQHGADIQAVDAKGFNFLHHCVFRNNVATGKKLIEKNVFNLETKTNNGDTALHLACYDDQADFVKLLIEKGADLHARNNQGQTPIHKTAYNMDSDVLNYLSSDACTQNIDWNVPDLIKANTPLHIAVKEGGSKDLDSFLKVGCDPLVANKYDLTPLHYALLLKQPAVAHNLIHHIASKDISLTNVVDKKGNTFLHYAATMDNYQVMAFLMKTGLDINTPNAYGETPLHIAIRRGHSKLAKWMVCSKDADLNVKNMKGVTPYQIADHHKDHNLKVLIDAGLQEKKINEKNQKGSPDAPTP